MDSRVIEPHVPSGSVSYTHLDVYKRQDDDDDDDDEQDDEEDDDDDDYDDDVFLLYIHLCVRFDCDNV